MLHSKNGVCVVHVYNNKNTKHVLGLLRLARSRMLGWCPTGHELSGCTATPRLLELGHRHPEMMVGFLTGFALDHGLPVVQPSWGRSRVFRVAVAQRGNKQLLLAL